jgi:hypothetical protein
LLVLAFIKGLDNEAVKVIVPL